MGAKAGLDIAGVTAWLLEGWWHQMAFFIYDIVPYDNLSELKGRHKRPSK